jgi:hypothetical protein
MPGPVRDDFDRCGLDCMGAVGWPGRGIMGARGTGATALSPPGDAATPLSSRGPVGSADAAARDSRRAPMVDVRGAAADALVACGVVPVCGGQRTANPDTATAAANAARKATARAKLHLGRKQAPCSPAVGRREVEPRWAHWIRLNASAA